MINPQTCLSDSLHNPRRHQHRVQEGPTVIQVSQYFQTVSKSYTFHSHRLILSCELYTVHAPWFWLKPLSLSLSVLSEQVPSDPDEPFFILSLTEIPVCSSGEVADSASEPLPYLPVTDASMLQQRLVPAFYQLVMPTPSRRVSGFVWCLILQLFFTPQQCSWGEFGSSGRWASL